MVGVLIEDGIFEEGGDFVFGDLLEFEVEEHHFDAEFGRLFGLLLHEGTDFWIAGVAGKEQVSEGDGFAGFVADVFIGCEGIGEFGGT